MPRSSFLRLAGRRVPHASVISPGPSCSRYSLDLDREAILPWHALVAACSIQRSPCRTGEDRLPYAGRLALSLPTIRIAEEVSFSVFGVLHALDVLAPVTTGASYDGEQAGRRAATQ
jgi:hypothetical protein